MLVLIQLTSDNTSCRVASPDRAETSPMTFARQVPRHKCWNPQQLSHLRYHTFDFPPLFNSSTELFWHTTRRSLKSQLEWLSLAFTSFCCDAFVPSGG